MNEEKCMLTISILASNRKDTLPKTLESIKPILENVSSELIVTDTGCDEELLDVIHVYTDKVVKFEWCNDFSKARNVGLKMAKGQWFMFLDDDEWFEDVSQIITFFNSDQAQKYKAFDYLQRNYKDVEGKSWNDVPVSRASRIEGNIRFIDKIHEQFSKALQPAILIPEYVHHYGYIYSNEEDKQKHAYRNLSLLEKQLEEGNHSLRQYHHMLQEYNVLEYHQKAFEMALQGIQKAKENNENIPRFLSGLKVNVVSALINMDRNEEAIQYAKQYVNEGELTDVALCAMKGYLAHGHYNIGNKEETIAAVKEYFTIYLDIIDNKVLLVYNAMLTSAVAVGDAMPNMLFNIGLRCAVEMGNEQDILVMLRFRKYLKRFSPVDNGAWLGKLLELMKGRKERSSYATIIIMYMSDLMCATKICNKLLDIKEDSEEEFMILTKELISTEIDNPHIKILRTIYNLQKR